MVILILHCKQCQCPVVEEKEILSKEVARAECPMCGTKYLVKKWNVPYVLEKVGG